MVGGSFVRLSRVTSDHASTTTTGEEPFETLHQSEAEPDNGPQPQRYAREDSVPRESVQHQSGGPGRRLGRHVERRDPSVTDAATSERSIDHQRKITRRRDTGANGRPAETVLDVVPLASRRVDVIVPPTL